jgi:hypothetical protein
VTCKWLLLHLDAFYHPNFGPGLRPSGLLERVFLRFGSSLASHSAHSALSSSRCQCPNSLRGDHGISRFARDNNGYHSQREATDPTTVATAVALKNLTSKI